MDGSGFDRFTRSLGSHLSRRGAIGAGLAAVGLGGMADGAGRRHRHGASRKGKKGRVAPSWAGSTVYVTGTALCGLAIFGCQKAQLVGTGYSQTVTPQTYNGTFRFGGVPKSRWYTLKQSYVGLFGYQCCGRRVWVGDPSTGNTVNVGSATCVRGTC